MISLLLLFQQPAFLNDVRPAWVVRGGPSSARTMAEAMREHHIQTMSLTVFENGMVVFSEVKREAPQETGQAFQFGSLSKVVAAVTALRLVDKGKLKLDDPIDNKLGDWKLPSTPLTEKQRVTLRRLLSHTSGLTVGGFPGYAKEADLPTLNQMLDGIAPANSPGMSFESEPGSKWKYSGGGYLVLQKLIETATKAPYAQVAYEEVLKPANMGGSGYSPPKEALSAHNAFGEAMPNNINPELAAAGIWSTTDDFARFVMAIPQLLKSRTFAELTAKGLGDWGLGVGVRGKTIWHSGRNVGYDTLFVATSDCRNGFVVAIDSNNDTGFLEEVQDAVFRAQKWQDAPAFMVRQAEDIPTATLDNFAGTYIDEKSDEVEIRRDRFRLFMNVSGQGWTPLTPTSATFFNGPGLTASFAEPSACEVTVGKRTRKLTKKPTG